MQLRFFPEIPEPSATFPALLSEDEIIKMIHNRCQLIDNEVQALTSTCQQVKSVLVQLSEQESEGSGSESRERWCLVLSSYIQSLQAFAEKLNKLSKNDNVQNSILNIIVDLRISVLKITRKKESSETEYHYEWHEAKELMRITLMSSNKDLALLIQNLKGFIRYQCRHELQPPLPKRSFCTLL